MPAKPVPMEVVTAWARGGEHFALQVDEDGPIEVADAMEDLGLAREIGPAEINLLCFSGDSDKDGKIDFSEFVNDFVHYDFESQVPCRTRSPRSLWP